MWCGARTLLPVFLLDLKRIFWEVSSFSHTAYLLPICEADCSYVVMQRRGVFVCILPPLIPALGIVKI